MLKNIGDKTLQEMSFKTFINGVGNDFKMAVDDLIGTITTIQEDVEKLKINTSKPSKSIAKALLEYLAMDEGKSKENMTTLCGKEIQKYLKWLDDYCMEHSSDQEETLNSIIGGEL